MLLVELAVHQNNDGKNIFLKGNLVIVVDIVKLKQILPRLRMEDSSIPVGHLHSLRHFFMSHNLNKREDPLNPMEMIRIVGHATLDRPGMTFFLAISLPHQPSRCDGVRRNSTPSNHG